MTWEPAANTMRERFRTLVAVPESLKVQYDNRSTAVDSAGVEVEDPTNETWIRLAIREATGSQVDMGAASKRYRTVGVMIAQILAPFGSGDGDTRNLADLIKAAFLMVTVSGVTFRVPRLDAVGRDKNWWLSNVNCPFYYDALS